MTHYFSSSEAQVVPLARIPETVNAPLSVCGLKAPLILADCQFGEQTVQCVAVAALLIHDSPIHYHKHTVETYTVLNGSGQMYYDGKWINIQTNDVILIPQGVEHGILSDNDEGIMLLMTFNPPLAPKEEKTYRDEVIVHQAASTILA